ncbi:uncharacterized protein LOC123692103 [Colias croceus]|uniref:uncharacterized protein LOC123692103 n=1 Tax=Colias crocea TaxID=72248 RepID=UPI001E2816CF|nr:uncharacterized protein LOC123692103 [Colias croceus]
MGKKRKHEKTDEEIRRKIKKLENRLAKRANQSTSDSSEENMISEPLDVPSPGSLYCQSPLRDHQTDEAPRPLSPCPPLSPQEIAPRPDSPRPDEVVEPQPGTSVDNDKQNEELELDEDVLQLLGDAPKTDTSLGPAIHKDVASRWQDILSKGLPKEIKDILYKEYLVPNNCDLLLAPALNPEVKAALPEALIKRDTSLSYRQKQLGVALSALATVTQMVIANETSKQKILKPLSDACRLLCDSHHAETRTRRKFVISSINTKLKDALIETKRDALLFGDNISDKLKAAKSIQQSGESLKNIQKPKNRPSVSVATNQANKGRLNYVPQQRQADNKRHDNRFARVPNIASRPPPSNSARRPPDRTYPPSKTPAPQRRQ